MKRWHLMAVCAGLQLLYGLSGQASASAAYGSAVLMIWAMGLKS